MPEEQSDKGVLAPFYRKLDTAIATAIGREELLESVSEDFAWEFSLPDRSVSGNKSDFSRFLLARAEAGNTHGGGHEIVAAHFEAPHEVVMGFLNVEGTPPSPFVAGAEIDSDGRMKWLMLRRTKLPFRMTE